MNGKVKHLYIHIPFCRNICDYCDFVRCKATEQIQKTYTQLIAKEISKHTQKFKTIYVGGGTPNSLSNKNLSNILDSLQKNIDKNTEFTIECNPEFINQKQINIFKKYNVNRISIGAQTTNEKILKLVGRKHSVNNVIQSIRLLQKSNIKNISLDFIYGFNELKKSDLKKSIELIKKEKITHVSFYSLELKENSALLHKKYKLDDEKIESDLLYIQEQLKKNKFKRYEISNWALDKKYFSQHNMAYWNTDEWIGLGYGAFGFEKNIYYEVSGKILEWKKVEKKLSKSDYHFQILMMGLRMADGINLKKKKNLLAYSEYKTKLNTKKITIKSNHLKAKKINLLNDVLVDIV